MLFGKAKPQIDRGQQLASRPILLVSPTIRRLEDGGIAVTVPLKRTSALGRLFRIPEDADKTFELDQMGTLVWDNIDGKTSVQSIIRRLAKRYNISLREAEASTMAFLRTLTRKGLIGMQVKK